MSRSKPSLQSLANSLRATHSQQQKPNIHVTLKDANPADRLLPGRHRCDCQARLHRLIRNCMECGRVVCEQEGSGPCFFCGELVCTREEREILNRKSRKSVELYNKLMGSSDATAIDGEEFSLSAVGSALTKAEQYRNKLLAADADTERRTRVHDLESDYYSMENNIFLTKEEREAIMARKEELKELRARQKRALIVDFDFEKAAVFEAKEDKQNVQDPVIQSILESSRRRQQAATSKPLANWVPNGFVPTYDNKMSRRSMNLPNSDDEGEAEDKAFMMLSDEMLYMEVARKGYAVGISQPVATLLSYGFRRHFPWNEDVDIRGPILIASKGKSVSKDEIEREISNCRQYLPTDAIKGREFPSEFPSGAIVGRALLTDSLSREEYEEKYPNSECSSTDDPYVLIFDVFEPLLVPIPHIPSSDSIYQVDKQLRTAIRQILDPVSFT